MTHNTTPKALSDAAQSVRNTALAMGNEWMDKNNEFVERIVSLKWDRVLAIALYIEAFEAGVALKAQPAPAPLAEDEALIAEAARNCRDNLWASRLAERLSLRSGQLAQAKKWISAIFRESGPGSHPGRTPEEAANEILNGGTNG